LTLVLVRIVKRYMCVICGFIYDEAAGLPEHGIMPGTAWADVPLTWRCPDCGAGKEDFEMIEML
jgi:rubredoxin